jgi:hypothetical protein
MSKMKGLTFPGNAIARGFVPKALRVAPGGTTVGVLLPNEIAANPALATFSR